MRKTLAQIQYYPTPDELYHQITTGKGWPYKDNQDFYRARDQALASILYLGDFRISEVLPLTKEVNFKPEKNYLLCYAVKVGKRKAGKIMYRDAKLPLEGQRAKLTGLIQKYLDLLGSKDRLFPWSLKERTFISKTETYKTRDGTVKQRKSVQLVGTHRAWQIIHALLPHATQHWLRAYGYNYDYDHMQHDVLAVSDKTKADPRSIQPYIRRRYEQYPVS